MNPPRPARVLLDTIISNLPTDYNISAIVQTAAKEDEPRASGGSCDVTLGEFAWNVFERNHGLWGRYRGARTGNEDSMRPISIKIAIKRARAHALYNPLEDEREKVITVRLHSISLTPKDAFLTCKVFRRGTPERLESGQPWTMSIFCVFLAMRMNMRHFPP